ncbi:hypothetical protein ACFOEE_17995 [Pseudoalteromonas fenneropenaei]|uniref:Uncharacterized protein n=1 Tax=Pseudoalteromonas fenneropenaei TaxID=1737459 RepID=A0ABV7CPG3_9GAMM
MKKLAKKLITLAAISLGALSVSAVAATGDDGVLKYSHNYVYLKCESSACGGSVTRWFPMKVYYKFKADIPPHSEVRLYWNKNEPADVAAGTRTAYTLGDFCPDGSRMQAKWFLDSRFVPTSAIATDCDGQEHTYSVHEFSF